MHQQGQFAWDNQGDGSLEGEMPERCDITKDEASSESESNHVGHDHTGLAVAMHLRSEHDGSSCEHVSMAQANIQRTISAKKARKKANVDELMFLLQSQVHSCALCGSELQPSTCELDHIVPVSDGGTHAIENLMWLCRRCNRAKGSMSMSVFLSMCQMIYEKNRRVLGS